MKNTDLKGVWQLSAFDTVSFLDKKILFGYDHFEDKEKIDYFKNKIFDYYDQTIKILSDKLNIIHQTNFSLRYWNYLVGPWLFKFLEYYFDKYLIIKQSNLKNYEFNSEYFKIKDVLEFYKFSQNNEYNKFIFNQINTFLHTGKYSINIKEKDSFNQIIKTKIKKKKLKSLKKNLKNFFLLFKKEDKYNSDITNFNLALKQNELFNLSNKKRNILSELISIFSEIEVLNSFIDKNIRNQKLDENLISKDEFIHLINTCLLINIPSSYLENFKLLNEFYSNQLKEIDINKLLLRSSTEFKDYYRYLIANLSENGTKIIAFQEGGIGKSLQQTEYVRFSKLFCDEFYIWSETQTKGAENFYCTKTFWIQSYKIIDKKILIVLGSIKPYFYSLYESSLPNFGFYQTNIVSDFITGLESLYGLEDVILRLHNDNGFREMEYYSKKFKKLNVENRKINPYFYHLLSRSRIKIFTSDYTANMQSYIINHPTILLWNDKMHLPNPNFEEIYEKLKKKKMLFSDPYECLKHIDNVNKNLNNWWFSDEVQSTRQEYLRNFCAIADNFKNEFLNKVIKEKT